MEKFEAPIQESLLQELIELWETIPELQTNEEWRRELLGLEPSFNRILIYIVREGGRVVAMCQFYISRRMPHPERVFVSPARGPNAVEGASRQNFGAQPLTT